MNRVRSGATGWEVNQRIEKLKDSIELNHHCRAEHVDSKAVIEMAGEKRFGKGLSKFSNW
jgi:glucose-6-phosphate dehydrogenase assembly protein OpcA